MHTMLIKERYKVVRALAVQKSYAFLETVDIKDRDKAACLLNIYEEELLPVYLDVFDRLSDCPDFLGAFIAEGSLVSVFEYRDGCTIDQIFYRGASMDWRLRIEFAELLLHKALTMANYPPEISCAAMLSDNLLVDLSGRRLLSRWQIVPMEGMNGRELVYLAVDHLKKILIKRFESPMEELEFMYRLDNDECRSVIQLYSLWRMSRNTIEEAYGVNKKKNAIRRWFSHLWTNIKWKMRKKKR